MLVVRLSSISRSFDVPPISKCITNRPTFVWTTKYSRNCWSSQQFQQEFKGHRTFAFLTHSRGAVTRSYPFIERSRKRESGKSIGRFSSNMAAADREVLPDTYDCFDQDLPVSSS